MSTERAVLRPVVRAVMREVRGSLLGPDTSRRLRIWALDLSCGHPTTRPVRYPKAQGRPRANGWHPRPRSEALPAPTRVRCEWCDQPDEPNLVRNDAHAETTDDHDTGQEEA